MVLQTIDTGKQNKKEEAEVKREVIRKKRAECREKRQEKNTKNKRQRKEILINKNFVSSFFFKFVISTRVQLVQLHSPAFKDD